LSVDKSFVLVANMDYEKFTRHWFEVKVHQPIASSNESSAIFPASMSPYPTSLGPDYYMHFEGKDTSES